jgi:hypothetical protein
MKSITAMFVTNGSSRLFYLPVALIAVLYLIMDTLYCFHAWFSLDDFHFLEQYRSNICTNEFISFTNFGRFLSRNVYWYAMANLFGMNPACYFLINLALLIIISFVCFLFVRQLTNSRITGVFSGITYFIMGPTQMNFAWLSDVQHLLGHFFILVFLLLSCNERFLSGIHRLRTSLILIVIFGLGIYSNMGIVAVIPSLIAYIVIFKGISGLDKSNVTLILIISLCSILFYLRLSSNLNPAYATQFTFSQFVDTLLHYATMNASWGTVKTTSLIFLTAVPLLLCATTVWLVFKRDRIGVFLVVLAGLFYMPFAFLVFQRYLNYMALPIFFFSSSIIYLIIRYLKAPVLVYLVLLMHIVVSAKLAPLYNFQSATGSSQRTFIEELNQLDLKGYKRVCLQSLEPQPQNKTGVPYWDMSATWHDLGDGNAMRLFGSVRADYLPYGAAPCLDQPTVLVDKRLNILRIIFP